jgi:hypothetical protein
MELCSAWWNHGFDPSNRKLGCADQIQMSRVSSASYLVPWLKLSMSVSSVLQSTFCAPESVRGRLWLGLRSTGLGAGRNDVLIYCQIYRLWLSRT